MSFRLSQRPQNDQAAEGSVNTVASNDSCITFQNSEYFRSKFSNSAWKICTRFLRTFLSNNLPSIFQ